MGEVSGGDKYCRLPSCIVALGGVIVFGLIASFGGEWDEIPASPIRAGIVASWEDIGLGISGLSDAEKQLLKQGILFPASVLIEE